MDRDLPIVGGLYASREDNGLYRVVKVLAVDDFAVHLRSYADRFEGLPSGVASSQLSLGFLGPPHGFGIGHFPLALEGFREDDRVLVGQEPVQDDELDGYRIWAGIEEP
jgi:hypothetical protein